MEAVTQSVGLVELECDSEPQAEGEPLTVLLALAASGEALPEKLAVGE